MDSCHIIRKCFTVFHLMSFHFCLGFVPFGTITVSFILNNFNALFVYKKIMPVFVSLCVHMCMFFVLVCA